jgi:autotransporter-associated beta strand protein
MKPRRFASRFAVITSFVIAISSMSPCYAASDSWDGSTDATWATGTNWLLDTTPPGAAETATFNGAGNGNTTIDLGAGVTLGSLVFDTSSVAAYTIGSGAVGSQTLTLGTVGGTITMNSTVAANQLFNSNLALAASTTANNAATYYKLTNNSTSNSLTLAGGISASTAGVKTLNVTGSGSTAISGAITSGSGNVSLFKTGSGTLTLSGGATFSGAGITDGANFTTSAVFREGLTILNGGTYGNSGGELVIGGVATHGGAGTNTTLQLNNGTTLNGMNWLSIGRGNGNGTATSNLTLNGNASISADNMSAGFNAGNAANISKGTITLNGTSSLNITARYHLGESPGSNMTMTLNDTSSVTLGNGVIAVGMRDGHGTLNVNSGSNFTTNGEIRVAFSDTNGTHSGSGTINVNGGTLSTNALTVARNNNDVASTLDAEVNVTAGELNVKSGSSLIGWRGTQSTGTVNISGGSFNQGTVSTANMIIGSFAGTTGAVNVSGTGSLTFQRNSNLLFSNLAEANASRSLTISGGNVAFYSDAGTTAGGTGVIDLMNTSNASGTSTINLNGGTLTANQIKATSATGTRVINFNGGTLKAAGSGFGSTFLASAVASTANVRNGGAIFDTNGQNVTIGQVLVHSTIGGDNAIDGGLTKQGAGTLTLTNTNTYTGATTIQSGGTLALTGTGSIANSSNLIVNGTLDVSGLSASTFTIGSSQKLSGNGTVNATDKTLSIAGTHAVGNSPGQQDVTGHLNYESGSIFEWDLNATTSDPGPLSNQGTYDQVAVTGDLTGSGAVFNILLGTNSFSDAFWSTNKTWSNIFTAANSFDLTSIFTSFSGAGVNSLGVVDGRGSFTFTGGNTLSWSAVPEPGSALAGLLIGAGLLRRRRARSSAATGNTGDACRYPTPNGNH